MRTFHEWLLEDKSDVPSNIYYWISKNGVPVGTSLSGSYKPKPIDMHREVEEFLENYRKENYPDRPSRIGSTFVADNIEDSKEWVKRLNCSPCYINKVSVEGNTFKVDGDLINFFFNEFKFGWKDTSNQTFKTEEDWWETMKKYADKYWQGNIIGNPYRPNPLPEIIVQGKITIISSDLDAEEQEKELARDQWVKDTDKRVNKNLVNQYGDKIAASMIKERDAKRADVRRQDREREFAARERRVRLGIEKPPVGSFF